MRRLLIGMCLLFAAALALAGPVAAQTSTSASITCRNTYGGDVIAAYRVGCRKARQVVRAWGKGFKRDRRIRRTARGYRCRGASDSVEGLTVRCQRGRAKIRFYANVP